MIAVGAIGIGALAWTPQARRATRVVAPVLPEPVRRSE
jgi:hypothetical protein